MSTIFSEFMAVLNRDGYVSPNHIFSLDSAVLEKFKILKKVHIKTIADGRFADGYVAESQIVISLIIGSRIQLVVFSPKYILVVIDDYYLSWTTIC